MEQNNNHNGIKKQITEAIKSGSLAMRPRWHFIFRTVLVILGMILMGLTILYLMSLRR